MSLWVCQFKNDWHARPRKPAYCCMRKNSILGVKSLWMCRQVDKRRACKSPVFWCYCIIPCTTTSRHTLLCTEVAALQGDTASFRTQQVITFSLTPKQSHFCTVLHVPKYKILHSYWNSMHQYCLPDPTGVWVPHTPKQWLRLLCHSASTKPVRFSQTPKVVTHDNTQFQLQFQKWT